MPIRLAENFRALFYAPYDATKARSDFMTAKASWTNAGLQSHEGMELAAIVASFVPTIAKDILARSLQRYHQVGSGRSLL